MINKKWKSSLQKVKTKSRSDCSSYQQLLVIDRKLRLKMLMKPPTVLRFDYKTKVMIIELRFLIVLNLSLDVMMRRY